MRTIEEIEKDIENAESNAREWYRKRDKFYDELKDAQKTDVTNFKGKYIRLGWDYAVMYVTDQYITNNEVKLEGIRIFEKDYMDRYDDSDRWVGEFSVGVSVDPLKFGIKQFKDLTVGPYTNMREISKEEFDDYIHEMLEEYKEKLNFENWL